MRIAVVGVGAFGRHHLRVIRDCPRAQLVAVFDRDPARAQSAAEEFGCAAVSSLEELFGRVDAAVVATPTETHAEVGCALLAAGIDVLIEKPVASRLEEARRLQQACSSDRILQVGHLERFNPAVLALREIVTTPLFFEIHRLSVFTPRSLDVDVVLDLMIHDIDLVLDLVGQIPAEIRAAGISILSSKVDIANSRLAFPGGCIANLTASRVSTEKVRKLRLFQPHQYVSIDYTRQDGVVIRVSHGHQIAFEQLSVSKAEPLKLQFESFVDCIQSRKKPIVGIEEAMRALRVAHEILDKIEEHAALVKRSLALKE
ncbi:MAG: Gfo/Idh/MocA family oxidoreductase [Bryobacteraceae bacterium]|nr:Gfo/Idh/MocA family oxidoreductase [Bryobacteraceae bacterium]MDW8379630.1 Gfo/Idh/MocA family oxidoreductase [Bryobacterales bacterium]